MALQASLPDFRSVGRHRQLRGWHLGPQEHPFHEMVMILSGGQDAELRGRRVTARAGDVLLFPAGHAHEEWCEAIEQLETIFIGFQGAALSGMPLLFTDERGRLRVMAEWLYAERETRSRTSAAVSNAILQAMMSECVALWERQNHSLVERLRHYVEQHVSDPISLADVSQALGLSRYHLIRKYRALTGHTPMADVTRIRVERARDMILTTSAPLKEIAPRVGLSDVYRMSRLFRRHLGVTPGSLRRR